MLNLDNMWQRVSELIAETSNSHLLPSKAMGAFIDFCRYAVPEEEALWDDISILEFDKECLALTTWLEGVLSTSPIPDEVTGLWFGLYNTEVDDKESCQFYCAGSTRFTVAEPNADWHCNPEYRPDLGYGHSDILHTISQKVDVLPGEPSYLGECFLCHGYLASLISTWCSGELKEALLGNNSNRAIAMGHDSGDMYFIHQPVVN